MKLLWFTIGIVGIFFPAKGFSQLKTPWDLLVVAHDSVVSKHLTNEAVRSLFLKKKTHWEDGREIVPIHANEGSELRNDFLQLVIGMSADEEKRYWQDMQIKQTLFPPQVKAIPLRTVVRQPGSVAYVRRSQLGSEKVQVLAQIRIFERIAIDKQTTIMVQMLDYEKNSKKRMQERPLLAILSSAGSASSLAIAEKLEAKLKGLKVHGSELNVMQISVVGADQLESKLTSQPIGLLYLSDGVDNLLPTVKRLAKQAKILVLAADPAYVWQGASLAVVERQKKTTVLINPTTLQEQGGQPDGRLLRLATLVN